MKDSIVLRKAAFERWFGVVIKLVEETEGGA